MWPYCGLFQFCKLLLLLEWIMKGFILLAIVNHEDYHLKFHNWSWDVKAIRDQSKYSLSLKPFILALPIVYYQYLFVGSLSFNSKLQPWPCQYGLAKGKKQISNLRHDKIEAFLAWHMAQVQTWDCTNAKGTCSLLCLHTFGCFHFFMHLGVAMTNLHGVHSPIAICISPHVGSRSHASGASSMLFTYVIQS